MKRLVKVMIPLVILAFVLMAITGCESLQGVQGPAGPALDQLVQRDQRDLRDHKANPDPLGKLSLRGILKTCLRGIISRSLKLSPARVSG